MGRLNYAGCTLFLLISIAFSGLASGQEDSAVIIEEEHKSFYSAGSEIDIDVILGLNEYESGQVLSVTIEYNMAFSSLKAQCLADGTAAQELRLKKGLGKSLTCDYDAPIPAQLALRLQGNSGQIQVTALNAKVVLAESGQAGEQTTSDSPTGSASGQAEPAATLMLERKTVELRRARHFEIVSPSSNDNWELGESANLYWNSSGIGGDVAIELFKDRDRVALITRKTPVSGSSYQWTVTGEDILPGGGYQVRMTTLADKRSHISEAFVILEDYRPSTIRKYTPSRRTIELKQLEIAKPVSLKVLSPKYEDDWHVLREYVIKWEGEGLSRDDDIGIALKSPDAKMAKIIGIVKNSGEYVYRVPYPLVITGSDMQVILTPLKDRSLEVLSEPFVIHKPAVDLIANTPTITYKRPQRPPKKWWQVLGDIFTGGMTWYVGEVVTLARLSAEGTTMEIDVNVINKGSESRSDVIVDCSIQTLWGNVLHSFESKPIGTASPDRVVPVRFSARTKSMGLKAGRYNVEILIDPDNKAREKDPFRPNNRVLAEFEVE